MTYAALEARANRLAHALRRRGVGPEALVALCLERSLDLIVAVPGVLKAGGACLPLDPNSPPERRAFLLADAAPMLILTQEALRPRLPQGVAALALDAEAARIAQESDAPLVCGARAENLAYVIYTSGSTGRPKGVAVAQGGLLNLALAQRARFGVTAESRVLQFAAATFDAFVSEFAMTLTCGACLVLPRAEERSGEGLLRLLEREGVTHATLPPAVLARARPCPMARSRRARTGWRTPCAGAASDLRSSSEFALNARST